MCVFSGLFDPKKHYFLSSKKLYCFYKRWVFKRESRNVMCVMLITVNRQLDEFLVIIFALGLFTIISLSARVYMDIIVCKQFVFVFCSCQLFIIIEIKKVYRKRIVASPVNFTCSSFRTANNAQAVYTRAYPSLENTNKNDLLVDEKRLE